MSDYFTAVNGVEQGGVLSPVLSAPAMHCLIHVACLFTALTMHGNVPDTFLCSAVIPIPKGGNLSLSSSPNFRGIALSSVYGKMMDTIILRRYSDRLLSFELQFGFKAKSSTNMCTMVLKETVLLLCA
jgi:hypothetical protein